MIRASISGYSPFFLLYGREARLPIEQLLSSTPTSTEENTPDAPADLEAMVQHMTNLRQATSKKAMENITKAQQRQKRNYDKRHDAEPLKPGEKVLLKNMKNSHRMGGKLEERWVGPYEIEELVKKGVYRLRNMKGDPWRAPHPLARTVTSARTQALPYK